MVDDQIPLCSYRGLASLFYNARKLDEVQLDDVTVKNLHYPGVACPNACLAHGPLRSVQLHDHDSKGN